MKPKLLLLHGALGTSRQLEPLKLKLANSFEVYSFDFPGHGGNTIPIEGMQMNIFVESIISFLDHKRIDKVNVFGYSMGGYAALKCAEKHPERINNIITLGTKFDWSKVSLDRELNNLNAELLLDKNPLFIEELIQQHKPINWKIIIHQTREMMINLCQSQALTETEFASISNKVFLLVGELDRMVSIEETQIACSKLKNGYIEILNQTKHPIDKVDLEILAEKIKQTNNY